MIYLYALLTCSAEILYGEKCLYTNIIYCIHQFERMGYSFDCNISYEKYNFGAIFFGLLFFQLSSDYRFKFLVLAFQHFLKPLLLKNFQLKRKKIKVKCSGGYTIKFIILGQQNLVNLYI